jgi:hypothetical protein
MHRALLLELVSLSFTPAQLPTHAVPAAPEVPFSQSMLHVWHPPPHGLHVRQFPVHGLQTPSETLTYRPAGQLARHFAVLTVPGWSLTPLPQLLTHQVPELEAVPLSHSFVPLHVAHPPVVGLQVVQ